MPLSMRKTNLARLLARRINGIFAATSANNGQRLPITKVIEAGPFVDRSTATAAIKVTGALLRPLFLACRIDSRAMRAGKMDDQLQIVRHPSNDDLDSAIPVRGQVAKRVPLGAFP
jgi:hypothetical protein